MEGFTAYLRDYKQFSPKLIGYSIQYVEGFSRWLFEHRGALMEQLTYSDMVRYIRHRQEQGYSVSYINHQVRSVRLYLDWLADEKRIAYNVLGKLHVKRRPSPLPVGLLDSEQLEQLYTGYVVSELTYPHLYHRQLRNKVILGLLVYQCLRIEELGRLKVQEIDLYEGSVWVEGGKYTNSRKVSLQSNQVAYLQVYLSGKEAKGPVFAYKAISQLVSNLFGACKSYLPEVRDSEQVRQSVVKEWLKSRDIRMVQYLCGYRYVSSLERYRTDQLEALQAALAKLHPLNKPCKEP